MTNVPTFRSMDLANHLCSSLEFHPWDSVDLLVPEFPSQRLLHLTMVNFEGG